MSYELDVPLSEEAVSLVVWAKPQRQVTLSLHAAQASYYQPPTPLHSIIWPVYTAHVHTSKSPPPCWQSPYYTNTTQSIQL